MQVIFHKDSEDLKWLYVVLIAPRKKQVFEAQVDEDDANMEVENASDEQNEDDGHEVNNNGEEEEEENEEECSKNSYDDEDLDLEIEYENLIGMGIDIGIDTMRDVIEDEFDEEALPQCSDDEL